MNQCEITIDKKDFDTVDAVLFHTAQIRKWQRPHRPNIHQIWISFHFENPLRNTHTVRGMVDMFNLTMSYYEHPDTDIQQPIG